MKYPKRIHCPFHYIKVKDPVYKYELVQDCSNPTRIKGKEVDTDYFKLTKEGQLTAKKGYRWDGASGPTIDGASTMRATLFHDLIWQLMQEGYVTENYRNYSNKLFRSMLIEDGMWRWRANVWYYTVDMVGRPYVKIKRKIYGRT